MRKATVLLVIIAALLSTSVDAHDLFFRARQYHVAAGADALVEVYTGTFSKSENAVKRDRPVTLELITADGRADLPRDRWNDSVEPKSVVRVSTGKPGTYLLAAFLTPRYLSLTGSKFNAYLKDEGIDEILAARKQQGRTAEASKERYQKFIKVLIQAGEARTGNATAVLGYDAEIVPEQNPYALTVGDRLTVRCLVLGKPWANKVIFAGGRIGTTERRIAPQRLVTDGEGRASVKLTNAGVWYVKFVSMIEKKGDPEANYESRWSTISFAVGSAPAPGRNQP